MRLKTFVCAAAELVKVRLVNFVCAAAEPVLMWLKTFMYAAAEILLEQLNNAAQDIGVRSGKARFGAAQDIFV